MSKFRRQLMMASMVEPVPPLPYDAEVEYLRSTGTQWFDLGVKLTNNSKIEIEYYSTDKSTNIFGGRVSISSKDIMGSIGGTVNNVLIDFNNSNYSTYRVLVSSFSSNRVRITAGKDIRSVYDVQHEVMKGQNTNACSDVFTCDTNAYLLAASGNPYYQTKLKCDLYYCKVCEDGELILDLIPVRVDQTGYLYNRVNNELLANAGTGDFILGNDVVNS